MEVRRERRRVYVRMEGEYVPDEELLRRAIARERELERNVRDLERDLSQSERRASELERERDEAKEALSAGRLARYELERAHEKETADHRGTWQALIATRVIVVVLLVVVGLLTWRLFA